MIPVSKPFIDKRDIAAVRTAVESEWVSSIGKYIGEFEEKLTNYLGDGDCLSTNNGTCGLHLMLAAANLKQGDEVIVPNMTFAASINAIIFTGATPVLADCEIDSKNVDLDSIKRLITDKTKAILVVHLYGRPISNISEIKQISDEHDLWLFEDCAESLGGFVDDQHVGNFGDAAMFSFFGNKIITTGEGGAVFTKNSELLSRMKVLRDHGMMPGKKYWHEQVGFNYRMTNIQAALGVSQLDKLDLVLSDRERIYDRYSKNLSAVDVLIPKVLGREKHARWLFDLWIPQLNDEIQRDNLRAMMLEAGIDTRPTFYPASLMPPYKDLTRDGPVAVSTYHQGIFLPTYYGLKNAQIDQVCDIFQNSLKRL